MRKSFLPLVAALLCAWGCSDTAGTGRNASNNNTAPATGNAATGNATTGGAAGPGGAMGSNAAGNNAAGNNAAPGAAGGAGTNR